MGLSASTRRRHLDEIQLRERAVLLRSAVARMEEHPEAWGREEGKRMATQHYNFMLRLEQYERAGDADPSFVRDAKDLLKRATEAVEAAIAHQRAAPAP